jgi:MFS transporter, CP family, cyanate transporter
VLRSTLPGLVGVFGSTVLLGVAITVGNIVVPVLIRRDVAPQYAALATGLFTCSLNIGSAAVTIGTAPVAALAGWRVALAASLLLVVIAVTGWLLAAGRGAFSNDVAPRFETGVVDVVATGSARRRFAPTRGGLVIVLLTTAFCGQAFAYYATTSWLPQLLADEIGQTPGEAGSSAAVFQLAAIIGGLGVPLLIARTSPVVTAVVVGTCWATIPAGLILAPEAWLLWSIVGGAAQGGGFTVVFTLIVRIARTSLEARRSSAVVQGVAYTVAAASPAVIGAIHDAVGGWTVPMLGVAGGVTAFLVCGTAAAVLAQPPRAAASR